MTDYIAAYRDYLAEEKHASANTLSSYIRDLTQFQSGSSPITPPTCER